jgi:hypothetical protein
MARSDAFSYGARSRYLHNQAKDRRREEVPIRSVPGWWECLELADHQIYARAPDSEHHSLGQRAQRGGNLVPQSLQLARGGHELVELHVSRRSGVMRLSTPVFREKFDGVLTSAETQAFLEMSKRHRSRWTASHTNRAGIVKARESRVESWDHALLTIHKSASPFSSTARYRGM